MEDIKIIIENKRLEAEVNAYGSLIALIGFLGVVVGLIATAFIITLN